MNKELALSLLRTRILEAREEEQRESRSRKKKEQVGSGMRADKRRTIALQRGTVVDHENDLKTTSKAYLRGFVDDLWR